jgi:hypothetical protein
MSGKRFSGGALAFKGFDQGRARRPFGDEIVFARVRLHFLETHFHLLEKPRLALRADAVNLASQFFDFEPPMRDEGVLRGCGGARLGYLGFRSSRTRFSSPRQDPKDA